jgi:hypothetical protein
MYLEEQTFTYSGEEVTVETLPDAYYQYTAYVTDVYGKTYTAGTSVAKMENGELSIMFVVESETVYPALG